VESGVTAGAKGTSAQKGYLKTSFGVNGYVIDGNFQTDSSKSSSVGVKRNNVAGKSFPGLDVSASLTTSEKDLPNKPKLGFFSTLNTQYSRDHFTAGVSLTSDEDSQHSVGTNASVGFNGFTVGADTKCTKVGPGAWEHLSYNAGISYNQGRYTALIRSDNKFEKLKTFIIVNELGNGGRTTAGVQAKLDLTQPKVGLPQREFSLGVKHKLSSNTNLRGVLVYPSNQAILSVSHKLDNPRLEIKLSAVTNLPNAAFQPASVAKFGVSLTFGEF